MRWEVEFIVEVEDVHGRWNVRGRCSTNIKRDKCGVSRKASTFSLLRKCEVSLMKEGVL